MSILEKERQDFQYTIDAFQEGINSLGLFLDNVPIFVVQFSPLIFTNNPSVF